VRETPRLILSFVPAWKAWIIVGLALTALGALMLGWRDLLGKAERMSDLSTGPKPASRWGFGLIAADSLLQVIGTASGPD
jgi:hypothetical protein